VDYAVDFRMSGKDLPKSSLIRDIYLVKSRLLATYKLDAIEAGLGRIIKTVDYNNLIAVF
jgi:hypothetical protein